MSMAAKESRSGAPIAMLAFLLVVWVGARALTWQNPFPSLHPFAPAGFGPLAAASAEEPLVASEIVAIEGASGAFSEAAIWAGVGNSAGRSPLLPLHESTGNFGHQLLWFGALGVQGASLLIAGDDDPELGIQRRSVAASPIAPQIEPGTATDRWFVDSWAFWRQGSNSSAISEGRVPIYGASQAGAQLQYRLSANSGHDPRAFARVYRALVSGGETELAVGASARALPQIPVRIAGELRVTENRSGTSLRPTVLAITELPVQNLPAGFQLEAYGGAGYVGGKDATAFADGQAVVTRQVAHFGASSDTSAKLSVGGGAWGGAQEGASRVDIGPTMRLDLSLGKTPARISVDWRERIGGDAAPGSGVAATLSTRF